MGTSKNHRPCRCENFTWTTLLRPIDPMVVKNGTLTHTHIYFFFYIIYLFYINIYVCIIYIYNYICRVLMAISNRTSSPKAHVESVRSLGLWKFECLPRNISTDRPRCFAAVQPSHKCRPGRGGFPEKWCKDVYLEYVLRNVENKKEPERECVCKWYATNIPSEDPNVENIDSTVIRRIRTVMRIL